MVSGYQYWVNLMIAIHFPLWVIGEVNTNVEVAHLLLCPHSIYRGHEYADTFVLGKIDNSFPPIMRERWLRELDKKEEDLWRESWGRK